MYSTPWEFAIFCVDQILNKEKSHRKEFREDVNKMYQEFCHTEEILHENSVVTKIRKHLCNKVLHILYSYK